MTFIVFYAVFVAVCGTYGATIVLAEQSIGGHTSRRMKLSLMAGCATVVVLSFFVLAWLLRWEAGA